MAYNAPPLHERLDGVGDVLQTMRRDDAIVGLIADWKFRPLTDQVPAKFHSVAMP